LRDLILADARARLIREVYFRRHARRLDDVLPADERFPLVFAGNHCKGAVFKDGNYLVTPQMEARFDAIARAMPEFYFGRFDVRCRSLDGLQRGQEFCIMEINGAGAEATHIWDPGTRLGTAYRALFAQFRALYEIGATNRRRGYRPIGTRQLVRDWIRYHNAAATYPETE
jgi:hypothetical protein